MEPGVPPPLLSPTNLLTFSHKSVVDSLVALLLALLVALLLDLLFYSLLRTSAQATCRLLARPAGTLKTD